MEYFDDQKCVMAVNFANLPGALDHAQIQHLGSLVIGDIKVVTDVLDLGLRLVDHLHVPRRYLLVLLHLLV